jgi:hypothetical protein
MSSIRTINWYPAALFRGLNEIVIPNDAASTRLEILLPSVLHCLESILLCSATYSLYMLPTSHVCGRLW